MNDKVAIVDIDGVVYDYVTKLADIAAIHLDKPRDQFPPSKKWYFFEDWGLNKKEYFDLVDVAASEYDLIVDGDPFPGAHEGWRALIDNGVRIHVATACGGSGEPDSHLRRRSRVLWLAEHGFEYNYISFVKDKASVVFPYLAEGKEIYAIDDSVHNFQALEATGAHTYLLNQAWNEYYETSNKINNMVEFADIVLNRDQATV